MKGLHRTSLTTSREIECAATALARQGEWGATSALSRKFSIARPTVKAAADIARDALGERFQSQRETGMRVKVDEAQLGRPVDPCRKPR